MKEVDSSHPGGEKDALLGTSGLSVRRLSVNDLPVTDKFLNRPHPLHQPTTAGGTIEETTVIEPLEPSITKFLHMKHGKTHHTNPLVMALSSSQSTTPNDPRQQSVSPVGDPQSTASTDPLDLVIAKRKRKELADPVIAEAIKSGGSKKPPPLVRLGADHHDQQEPPSKSEFDPDLFNFLNNYDLDRKPKQSIPFSPPPPPSLCSRWRTKCRESHLCQLCPTSPCHDREEEGSQDDDESLCSSNSSRDLATFVPHSDDDWFMEAVLHVVCMLLIIVTLPLSLVFCFKVVAHYERAVLFRLGRLVSATAKGPGLIFVLPCLDRYRLLDLRTFTFDVPTQEVLTKDSVTVVVNAVVYYRVRDPVRAVVNVEDANRATRVLGQTTLRNVLGTVNLDQLLTAREDIAAVMQECLDAVTEAWGVKVERVEIKDVRLPIQLQRAMAAEAESVREATAKVIAAEGEQRASGALKAAASEIKQHPIAMQLRYLQTVGSIASGKDSTIVFPVPMDFYSLFASINQHQTTSHPDGATEILSADPSPARNHDNDPLVVMDREVLFAQLQRRIDEIHAAEEASYHRQDSRSRTSSQSASKPPTFITKSPSNNNEFDYDGNNIV